MTVLDEHLKKMAIRNKSHTFSVEHQYLRELKQCHQIYVEMFERNWGHISLSLFIFLTFPFILFIHK